MLAIRLLSSANCAAQALAATRSSKSREDPFTDMNSASTTTKMFTPARMALASPPVISSQAKPGRLMPPTSSAALGNCASAKIVNMPVSAKE